MSTESSPAVVTGEVAFGTPALARLLAELVERGFRVVAPSQTDGVIDLRPVTAIDDLPSGWTDEQAPGRYRSHPSDDLRGQRDDQPRFGYAVGPTGAKRWFHPPEETVWTMRRSSAGGLEVEMHTPEPAPLALFGIRPCDLAGLSVLDRVLTDPAAPDTSYRARRTGAFTVVVNCGTPASTCFCTSMGTGPHVLDDTNADIVLSEVVIGGAQRYVGRAITAVGADVLSTVDVDTATAAELDAVARQLTTAERSIQRRVPAERCHTLLDHLDHPSWEAVGDRCLACGNCTLVCPTCFCTSPDDRIGLDDEATRTQVWDHCFHPPFSQLGATVVRGSVAARYRQWATHKLASWFDQFGTSGCVGCGRCITWCPVGIDIVEEARAVIGGDDA